MIAKYYESFKVSAKMRGNWDQAEALLLSANEHQPKLEEEQQQQHHQDQQQQLEQQHTIVEASAEERNPLQSTTTPAWGTMGDAIAVKEEPNQDDKHNDSGISPGHYMSESASPNSRSSANCSLSPGSASSQDSHNVPITNGFEYSPQNAYKQCDSPPESVVNGQAPVTSAAMEENSSNPDASPPGPSNDTNRSNTAAAKVEELECSPDPLQCPICVFSTQSRLRFSEHLKSHCTVASNCDETEFTKSVMDQLTNGGSIGSPEDLSRASPTQNERNSDHEVEEADEPGLRVPRVNSQGKVKTFRCKQCDFIAITKLDFWEHSRSHIKIEKLLTCPRCPFVTEYKHHLEYHLRNHAGSKPYKCDKCNYSCVNKSMLNSHLKSHSNVYQFRCADCAYATKYCHSLKLHLRKYKHNPAMVLNADGSPNPFPIIDVYGTRRGPKAKPKKDAEQQQQAQQQAQQQQPQQPQQPTNSANSLLPTVVPQQSAMQPIPFQFNPLNSITGLPKINGFNGFNGFNGATPAGGLGLPPTPSLMGFPYNPLFTGFPMPNPFALGAGAMPDPKEQQLELFKANLIEAARSFNGVDSKIEEQQQQLQREAQAAIDVHQQLHMGAQASNDVHMPEDKPCEDTVVVKQEPVEPPAPLDLRKAEVPVAPKPRSQAPVGTSRRKGRAVKLDKRVMQHDSDDEMGGEHLMVTPPSVSPASSSDSKDSAQHFTRAVGMSNEFTCHYCDISFGNEIMHSMHMGYHGYQNPYTCNMCGIQCTEKVSFFLHIARSKH